PPSVTHRDDHYPYTHLFPTRRSSDLAELLRKPQAKSGHGSRNGPPLGRLQLCRRGSNSQREGVQNRRRLAANITSRRLHSNGLQDRKSTRLNSSHGSISYAVFCLKKK